LKGANKSTDDYDPLGRGRTTVAGKAAERSSRSNLSLQSETVPIWNVAAAVGFFF
jgi:hypothetical protein